MDIRISIQENGDVIYFAECKDGTYLRLEKEFAIACLNQVEGCDPVDTITVATSCYETDSVKPTKL